MYFLAEPLGPQQVTYPSMRIDNGKSHVAGLKLIVQLCKLHPAIIIGAAERSQTTFRMPGIRRIEACEHASRSFSVEIEQRTFRSKCQRANQGLVRITLDVETLLGARNSPEECHVLAAA